MSSKCVKVGWLVTSVIDVIGIITGWILKSKSKDCYSPTLKTGLALWLIYAGTFNLFLTWFIVVWRQVLIERYRFKWTFWGSVVMGPAIRITLIVGGIVILSTATTGCNKTLLSVSTVEIISLFLTILIGLIDTVEGRKRHLIITPYLVFDP